jgi:O-acetyl-ADP-ribose deacetylase (regulator of RNase III)
MRPKPNLLSVVVPFSIISEGSSVKIVLSAIEPGLLDAWTKFCGDLDCVTVHEGSILDASADAVVSPANSFGFMDGGIDARYTQHFGRHVQERLRRLILEHHHGELLVGSAEMVETDHGRFPYLIAAPTMRVPMVLGEETINPYLATRAVLLLVNRGTFVHGKEAGTKIKDRIQTVAFPGMGTGVGRVSYAVCARQVRAAIEDFVLEKYNLPRSWAEASERHQLLYTDRLRRLQY